MVPNSHLRLILWSHLLQTGMEINLNPKNYDRQEHFVLKKTEKTQLPRARNTCKLFIFEIPTLILKLTHTHTFEI